MAVTPVDLPIPGFTVAAGDQVIGPFDVPVGWRTLDFLLDMAALVSPLFLTIDYAPDGVTFQTIGKLDFDGPYSIRGGPLITVADAHLSLGVPAPDVTPKIRLTVTNTGVAWVSTGGSVKVN